MKFTICPSLIHKTQYFSCLISKICNFPCVIYKIHDNFVPDQKNSGFFGARSTKLTIFHAWLMKFVIFPPLIDIIHIFPCPICATFMFLDWLWWNWNLQFFSCSRLTKFVNYPNIILIMMKDAFMGSNNN